MRPARVWRAKRREHSKGASDSDASVNTSWQHLDVGGILDVAQFLALLRNSVQTCEQSQAQLKACAEEADIMLLIQKTEADIVAVGLVEKDLGEWLRTAKQAFKEFNAAARRGGLDRRRKNTAEQRRLLSPFCKTVPSAVHSILYDDLARPPLDSARADQFC